MMIVFDCSSAIFMPASVFFIEDDTILGSVHVDVTINWKFILQRGSPADVSTERKTYFFDYISFH